THAQTPVGGPDLLRAFLGRREHRPYALSDMATDAVGLLDHLQVARAHVVGTSMGGMIAQTIAIRHPDRVASLTSVMSTTGRRTVGWQHPKLLRNLLVPIGSGREIGRASCRERVKSRVGRRGVNREKAGS